MSGQTRREARRRQAYAEFAAYPAPPTPGMWRCPRDPGQFRLYDGVGWTDWTREPAKQPEGYGGQSVQPPAEPSKSGSAIERGRAEMRQGLHPITDEELRGIPEATAYDLPESEGRGWRADPAAPDILQRRFHTGTEWSDIVAIVIRNRASYYRSTLEESRRRNELALEEQGHQPTLVLGPAMSAWVVLFTTVACCLLIVAPALPAGTASDLAHSGGVAIGLVILFLLCSAAVDTMRRVPAEWRSSPLWVWYGLAIPAFVIARGFRSVLSALGFP